MEGVKMTLCKGTAEEKRDGEVGERWRAKEKGVER